MKNIYVDKEIEQKLNDFWMKVETKFLRNWRPETNYKSSNSVSL